MSLEDLVPRLREWAERVAEQARSAMIDEIEDRVPIGDGESRPAGTLKGEREVVETPYGFEITYPSDVANYTDEGTDPHRIDGNPLLAFDWNGARVIVHHVEHPGTTGTRWFSDWATAENWRSKLDDAAASVPF